MYSYQVIAISYYNFILRYIDMEQDYFVEIFEILNISKLIGK